MYSCQRTSLLLRGISRRQGYGERMVKGEAIVSERRCSASLQASHGFRRARLVSTKLGVRYGVRAGLGRSERRKECHLAAAPVATTLRVWHPVSCCFDADWGEVSPVLSLQRTTPSTVSDLQCSQPRTWTANTTVADISGVDGTALWTDLRREGSIQTNTMPSTEQGGIAITKDLE